MSASRILGLMVVSAWLEVGCSGAKKIDVGGACILNSDCNSPLVCTAAKCHDACHTSADCPTGESCIIASDQSTVCQLPAETHCIYDSDCPMGLKCATDQRCRNQCQGDVDCFPGQICTTTQTCAEPNQVDSNRNLYAPDGGFGGSDGASGGDAVASCLAGAETCSCYPNDTCNTGLTCASHLCVRLGATGGTGGTAGDARGAGGSTGSGGATSSSGTDAGTVIGTGGTTSTDGGCPTGSETCSCYANNTCNGGLICLSNLCVRPLTGGAAGAGGTLSTGGTASTGGITASGGIPSTGGTGFRTPDAGTSNPDGASAGGGMGGSSSSGGTVASGGAPGTGGSSSSGGIVASGGSATGGTPSTGGTTSSPPDAAVDSPALIVDANVSSDAAGVSDAPAVLDVNPVDASLGDAVPQQQNLMLWLNAATITGLADGTNVATWSDGSGNGRNVSAAGTPPTYRVNQMNGLPIVRFDGTDDELSTAGNFGLSGDPSFTVTLVAKISSSNSPSGPWMWAFDDLSHALTGACLQWRNGTLDIDTGDFNQAYPPANSFAAYADVPSIVTIRRTPGEIGQTTEFFFDGTKQSVSGVTATPTMTDGLFYVGSGLGQRSIIDIAELLAYGIALRDADRVALECSLGAKYNITVAGCI